MEDEIHNEESEKLESKDVKLTPFIQHGVIIEGYSGNQAYGTAPFASKFYVNTENQLWDSKTKNISGNLHQFLVRMNHYYQQSITPEMWKKLSLNRNLPIEALKEAKIGGVGNKYTFPIYSETGKLFNIKTFKLGSKLFGTAGITNSIWNVQNLVNHKDSSPVYLCEGEWDAVAFNWLLKKNKEQGIAVGLPGATSLKNEWVRLFERKNCVSLMDNDKAGYNGEKKIIELLSGKVLSIKYLHWPKKYPDKFDIRDFVGMEAVKNKRPKRCLEQIRKMLRDFPRVKTIEKRVNSFENDQKPELEVDKSITWKKLTDKIRKWMKIDDFDPLKVATAITLSNFIDGDPVWMFLVACPGVGKSEIMGMFKYCPDVYTTSSITPNALISGSIAYRGREPSLLPKLNKKMLCIKDFSTIQTMRDADRDSLLGILRDAYDGSAGKVFGTGESKHFDSKFSILAGVTPSIYEMEHHFSSLGERFLKIFIGEYLDHKEQKEIITQAITNVGKEDKMREEFAHSMFSFIENMKSFMTEHHYKIPNLSPETEKKIVYLAMWCSRMKGTVNRDKWERDVITNKAYSELGTRTGKQLKRLLLCFPTVISRGRELDEDYELLKRIVLDSVSAKREDVFRAVYMSCETKEDTIDIKQIMHLTKYDYSTTSRTVDDLIALKIIERIGFKKPLQYKITEKVVEITKNCELYSSGKEKKRPFKSEYFSDLKDNKNPKGE